MSKDAPRTISLTVTQSSIKCFQTCQHKWNLRYRLGIRPVGKSKSLTIGTAVHAAIEAWYKGHIFPPLRFMQSVITHNGPHVEYDIVAAAVLFSVWQSKWQPYDRHQVSHVEHVFTKKFGRTTVMGKIDRMVGNVVVDTKTTSEDISPGSRFWHVAEIDMQDTLYAYVMGTNNTMRDVIRKPDLEPKEVPLCDDNNEPIVIDDATGARSRTKQGTWRKVGGEGFTAMKRLETPEEYGERLLADIQSRPDHYYGRLMLTRDENDFERLKQTIKAVSQEMKTAIKRDYFHANTSACKSFGGCEYLSVCKTISPSYVPEGFEVVQEMHEELK